MGPTKRVAVLLILTLLAKIFVADQPSWIVTKPILLKKDARPAKGLLETKAVKTFFQCAFFCNQNVDCLMFAFNGNECAVYEYVFPKPNPEFKAAKGYMTYQGRNKVYKLIEANYLYDDGNEACKKEFGGRLASPTDIQSFNTLAEVGRNTFKGDPDCDGYLIGLRSKGTNGTFELANGVTININDGKGFQRWQPGPHKADYKKGPVNVQVLCRPQFGHWEQIPLDKLRWPYCEVP